MASPSSTGGEYPPELVHGELCATRFSLKAVCDCGKEPEPGPASVSPAEPPGGRCPDCGGPVQTQNFNEATITNGPCGYSWAAHFGGGEPQIHPCRAVKS